MSEKLMFREEELVLAAAPFPVLSGGLRSRVLSSAAEARARRSQGRRVLAGSVVVFALMGWLAWTGPVLPSVGQLAGGGEPPAEDLVFQGEPAGGTSSVSRRERFIAAMDDDWRMVEAEFEAREEFSRRVRM
jgi:hypothetical protein